MSEPIVEGAPVANEQRSLLDQVAAIAAVAVIVPGAATAIGVFVRWAFLMRMGWSAPAFKTAMLGPVYETPLLGAALMGGFAVVYWPISKLRHKLTRRVVATVAALVFLVPIGYVAAANSYSSGAMFLLPPTMPTQSGNGQAPNSQSTEPQSQNEPQVPSRTAAYFEATNGKRFVVVGQRDGITTLASCGAGTTVRQIPTSQIIYMQDVRSLRLTRPAC